MNKELERKAQKVVTVYPEVNKGTAIPVQVRTGPEGSRRLRLPDL